MQLVRVTQVRMEVDGDGGRRKISFFRSRNDAGARLSAIEEATQTQGEMEPMHRGMGRGRGLYPVSGTDFRDRQSTR